MMDDMRYPQMRGPWKINGVRLAWENPFMAVREYDIVQPDGVPGSYGVMSPKQLAIGVFPLHEDGTVTLVGQHRFPLDRYSWEIPEGGGRLDGDPMECGARELREETGLSAARLVEIMQADMSNSITTERAIGFLATGLSEGEADPEGVEVLETRRISFRALLDEIMSGKIEDALTVAMALRVYYMAKEGELEASLAEAALAG